MRFHKWTSSLRKRIRPKKSTRAKKSARLSPFGRAIGIGGASIVVMGAALLAITASGREPAVPAHPRVAEAAPAQMPATPADAAAARSTAADAQSVDALVVPDQKKPVVTITGCLERADETFRLKDTAGSEAPKARSWKSGFLKKSPATIEVIDGGNRAKLPTHVGQRVSVTGVLVDREMQLRSLQRVAPSCSKTPRA
jgi:hypothetical protein